MASLHKRNDNYYAQYYVGGQQRRVSLKTTNYQLAKEKLRQMESAIARGDDGAGLPNRYRKSSAACSTGPPRNWASVCQAQAVTQRQPSNATKNVHQKFDI